MKPILILSILHLCFASSYAQNIGIGTNTPSEKLEINGNLKVSGNIVNESPIDVVFQSNWSNGTESYIGGNVRYYKDKEKRVHLSGGAERHPGAGNTIFILPVGYRPSDTIFASGVGGPDMHYRVSINPDGSVQSFGSNQQWISLSNISFRVN
jgi:hypothetical protein